MEDFCSTGGNILKHVTELLKLATFNSTHINYQKEKPKQK